MRLAKTGREMMMKRVSGCILESDLTKLSIGLNMRGEKRGRNKNYIKSLAQTSGLNNGMTH